MVMKKILVAAAIAASLGSAAAPAADVFVRIAPPPPREEVLPPPRHGFIWVPGHWEWSGRRHIWVHGLWLRERHGYRYREPAWVEREGRWTMERGRWERGDRDHDGVPNRFDRDRDGDGVPNRNDRRPNDPNRY